TINLSLSSPNNATLGTVANATLTIVDNDISLPTVSISASDPIAAEAGPDSGALTITRAGGAATPLTVHYTVGGTAAAGSDYAVLSSSITIPAGQASASIAVTPIDDVAVEGTETVIVMLSAHPGYIIGAGASATITIADND